MGDPRRCSGGWSGHSSRSSPTRPTASERRSVCWPAGLGRRGLRHGGGCLACNAPGAGGLASGRCPRLGGDRLGRRSLGNARGDRGVVRDPCAPPRIPRVPAEGGQEDAWRGAGCVRRPGTGVPLDRNHHRAGGCPRPLALPTDAARKRDAPPCGRSKSRSPERRCLEDCEPRRPHRLPEVADRSGVALGRECGPS